MASLSHFLRTGCLGPLALGMNPSDVADQLGEPESASQKTNPLTLKYGSLQLVFWRHAHRSQLREITINCIPKFELTLPELAFDDFFPGEHPTEEGFRAFITQIDYKPMHIGDLGSQPTMIFLSGVIVAFANGLLNSIKLKQKEKRESARPVISDTREPTKEQIQEMIHESEDALKINARRSALLMAWAALEATLRQTALQLGRHGQIGVQPAILVRELLSAGLLSRDTARQIEELRQLRMASAHGLAPVDLSPDAIRQMHIMTREMLTNQDTGSY